MNRLQRLYFRLDRQPVARFGFDRGRAVRSHLVQSGQDFLLQDSLPCPADRFHTRADATASGGDLLIRSALDALLEIHETRGDKGWMGVGVDKARQHDFAGAVYLHDFLAILFQPGIAQGVFGGANGDYLSAEAEDGGVLNDAEFFESGTTARAEIVKLSSEREQLANVSQEKSRCFVMRFLVWNHCEAV